MQASRSQLPVFFLMVVALLALAAFLGWRFFPGGSPISQAVAPVPAASPAESLAETPPLADAPPVALAPAIENPIEAPASEAAAEAPLALPALADADRFVEEQLGTLFSRQDLLTYLQLDGFVRKGVATVDNLARAQAASRMWPVNPTPQRFSIRVGSYGVETVHPANAQRYATMVRLIESVDTDRAVAVYRGLYPLFQQAYEDLGFPNGYFNDRLVQVIDHLLATPVPADPPAVALVEVKGSVPSLRPWVRYEFVDPALEAESAGRKILLRVGADNQRRLLAKLKDFRQRVAKP